MKKINAVSDYLPILTSYLKGELSPNEVDALEIEIENNASLKEELECLRHYFELFPAAPPPHVMMEEIWNKMLPNLVGVAEVEEPAPSEAKHLDDGSVVDMERHAWDSVPPKLLAESYKATEVREPDIFRPMALGVLLIGSMALASFNSQGGLNIIKAGATLDDLHRPLFLKSYILYQPTSKAPITTQNISPYLYYYPPITNKPCSKQVEETQIPNYACTEGNTVTGNLDSEYLNTWNSGQWINNLANLLNSVIKDNPDISFFSSHGENAFVAGLKSKVPPSLIYVLASERSKNGQSAAAIKNNNFFNIPKEAQLRSNFKEQKGNSSPGDIELDQLKKYANPQESFDDFANALADQPMLKQSVEKEIQEANKENSKLAVGQEKETKDSVKIALASMLENLPPLFASRFE